MYHVNVPSLIANLPNSSFLDEPTSGLDSQSAWNLVRFLRKLANNGQGNCNQMDPLQRETYVPLKPFFARSTNHHRFCSKVSVSHGIKVCQGVTLIRPLDRLLLLERGGETVYFGDIGSDSYVVREYFARHGAVCPPNVNPAEYMLEAIGAGVTPRVGDRDWKDIWLDSPEYQRARQEINDIKSEALKKPVVDKEKMSTCEHGLISLSNKN